MLRDELNFFVIVCLTSGYLYHLLLAQYRRATRCHAKLLPSNVICLRFINESTNEMPVRELTYVSVQSMYGMYGTARVKVHHYERAILAIQEKSRLDLFNHN